jgi:RNA polymerase sigma-70 factor (ECF subfamily)
MDQISDEDLMLRIQQSNDRTAFAELFRRYRGRITSYATRLAGNRAEGENLAQETFLRVLEKGHLYSYPRRFSTWIFTIARNLTTDFQKKKRAITSESFDLMADAQRDSEFRQPDISAMQDETTRALARAIDQLPPQHREVLILRAFYDMSYREIAEIVGCPESTARSRMDYAVKELKSFYRRTGDGKKDDIS